MTLKIYMMNFRNMMLFEYHFTSMTGCNQYWAVTHHSMGDWRGNCLQL